jgi:hypothetical protein
MLLIYTRKGFEASFFILKKIRLENTDFSPDGMASFFSLKRKRYIANIYGARSRKALIYKANRY